MSTYVIGGVEYTHVSAEAVDRLRERLQPVYTLHTDIVHYEPSEPHEPWAAADLNSLHRHLLRPSRPSRGLRRAVRRQKAAARRAR